MVRGLFGLLFYLPDRHQFLARIQCEHGNRCVAAIDGLHVIRIDVAVGVWYFVSVAIGDVGVGAAWYLYGEGILDPVENGRPHHRVRLDGPYSSRS